MLGCEIRLPVFCTCVYGRSVALLCRSLSVAKGYPPLDIQQLDVIIFISTESIVVSFPQLHQTVMALSRHRQGQGSYATDQSPMVTTPSRMDASVKERILHTFEIVYTLVKSFGKDESSM